MTYSLDIVSVGIKDEGRIVVWVVMCPQTRRAVIGPACRDCGPVERINSGAVFGHEGNVNLPLQHIFRADPEIRQALRPKSGIGAAVRPFRSKFASSAERVRSSRRSLTRDASIVSCAFVRTVCRVDNTSDGFWKRKNGITRSQLRRQLCATLVDRSIV